MTDPPSTSAADVFDITAAISIKEEADDDDEDEYEVEIESAEDDFSSAAPAIDVLDQKDVSEHQSSGMPILDYCRRVIVESYKTGQKAECAICHSLLQPWGRFGATPANLLSHVFTHMSIPFFHCRYCDHSAITKWELFRHLKSDHKVATTSTIHYDDRTEENRGIVCKMIDSCFKKRSMVVSQPKEAIATASGSASVHFKPERINQDSTVESLGTRVTLTEAEAYLLRLCREIIDQSSPNAEQICCKICNVVFPQWTSSTIAQQMRVYHHVLGHMSVQLFHCRICPFKVKTKPAIIGHLEYTHKLPYAEMSSNFSDLTDKNRRQIVEMAKSCFQTKQYRQGHKRIPASTTIPLSSIAAGPFPPEKLCLQLSFKHGLYSSIRCRLCQAAVLIRGRRQSITSKYAIDHACAHLENPIYECMHCGTWAYLPEDMKKHVHQAHGTLRSDAYTDHRKKFEPEITAIVNQCYNHDADKESDSGMEEQGGTVEIKTGQPLVIKGAVSGGSSASTEISKVQVLKNPPQVKRLAFVKFRNVAGGIFKCTKCRLQTKNKKLMMNHLKHFHGK